VKTLTALVIILMLMGAVYADSTGENFLEGLYEALQTTAVGLIWADYVSSALIINMNPRISEGHGILASIIDRPGLAIPIMVGFSIAVYTLSEALWDSDNWIIRAIGFVVMTAAVVVKGKVLADNIGVIVSVKF